MTRRTERESRKIVEGRQMKQSRERLSEKKRERGREMKGERERGGKRSSGYVKEERRRQATLRASQAAGRQPLSQSTP